MSSEQHHPRARKVLACTAEATRYQKAFAGQLRERVVQGNEPFALAQADTPHEIFHAMDIPLISNQWWSALYLGEAALPTPIRGAGRTGLPVQQLPLLFARSGLHVGADPAQRPGEDCRGPRCWWRDSRCDCIHHVSRNGPTRWARNSFRSKRPPGMQKRADWFAHAQPIGKRSFERGASS